MFANLGLDAVCVTGTPFSLFVLVDSLGWNLENWVYFTRNKFEIRFSEAQNVLLLLIFIINYFFYRIEHDKKICDF
jgi:hypothetical protein